MGLFLPGGGGIIGGIVNGIVNHSTNKGGSSGGSVLGTIVNNLKGGGASGASTPTSAAGESGPGGGSSSPNGYTQKYTGGSSALDSALKGYSDQYAAARAAGDWQGMQRANEEANKLRNQYGYAAEFAYEDINKIRNMYPGSGAALGGGGAAQQAQQPEYPYQFGSLEEMREALGYDQVSQAQQQAIDAYIQQTVNGLNAQKSGINQSADELARQAYVSYMQSANKLPQALAAQGYSGGMADSQRIALDTTLQNNQTSILQNRDNALNGVDTAINNAKLEGSIQGAQAQAELGRDAISAYQNYVNQANQYANSDYWQKFGYDFSGSQADKDRLFQASQSQADRDWQGGQNQADRDAATTGTAQKQAFETAWNMIVAGLVPNDALLQQAGISKADAQAYAAKMKADAQAAAVKGKNGGSSGGSSGMSLSTAKSAAQSGVFDENVLSVLRKNGYTDEMLAAIYSYDPYAGDESNQPGVKDDTGLSPAARSILESYRNVNPGTGANIPKVFEEKIRTALKNREITEEDAGYLLSILGY